MLSPPQVGLRSSMTAVFLCNEKCNGYNIYILLYITKL
nr:MAG TPA: hypothetical protein [Caudoviricetes sp.]